MFIFLIYDTLYSLIFQKTKDLLTFLNEYLSLYFKGTAFYINNKVDVFKSKEIRLQWEYCTPFEVFIC